MFECTSKMTHRELCETIQKAQREHSYIKVGPVTLLPCEADEALARDMYLVTYSAIWQAVKDVKGNIKGKKVYTAPKGHNLARRGSYYSFTRAEVNHIFDINL